ncbi:MAG: undecaprenyl-phosphate galactose phosphotransferase WbaP [Treponema sp.]|nr:undecaprenyl-phosphate galactose phosphotransferase WbaP [Treponema sp.]
MTNSDNKFYKHLKKTYPHRSSFISGLSLMIVDIVILMFCIMLGFFIVNLFAKHDINFRSFINYTVFLPIMLIFFSIFGLYPGIMIPASEEVRAYIISSFISFIVIFLSIVISTLSGFNFTRIIIRESQKLQICIAFLIAFIFSAILLPAFREMAKRFFCKFKWYGVPAVIYSTNNSYKEIADKLLKNKYLGYKPAVIIESGPDFENDYCEIPIFSAYNEDIIDQIHKYNVKTAIMCDYKGDTRPIMNCYRYTISVSSKQTSFTSTQQLKDIGGIIGFSSIHNLTFGINIFLKRLLDIGLIIFFSPFLIPIFLILMILVKVTSKGPIFYGHKRVGKNGKEIKCWKFRSMYKNSQEMLEEILANDPVRREEWERDRKFVDDPRVTKFGKFLRKTSLDELPQLINILLGQMSFVGPRPVTKDEIAKYGDYADYVLSVIPGLSGMWQISGRSETSYEERIAFDTYYIQNWSIWLDIWIIIKTVWVVLKGKGAY